MTKTLLCSKVYLIRQSRLTYVNFFLNFQSDIDLTFRIVIATYLKDKNKNAKILSVDVSDEIMFASMWIRKPVLRMKFNFTMFEKKLVKLQHVIIYYGEKIPYDFISP